MMLEAQMMASSIFMQQKIKSVSMVSIMKNLFSLQTAKFIEGGSPQTVSFSSIS